MPLSLEVFPNLPSIITEHFAFIFYLDSKYSPYKRCQISASVTYQQGWRCFSTDARGQTIEDLQTIIV